MSRSEQKETASGQSEKAKGSRRFRWEFGMKEVLLYGVGLIVAFSWMFVFGILVGRGIPLLNSDFPSIETYVFRLLGLEKEMTPPAVETKENWDSPEKMLSNLNYYEDLTQGNSHPTPHLKPLIPVSPPGTDSNAEKAVQKEKNQTAQVADFQELLQQPLANQSLSKPPREPHLTDPVPGQFTLLISSLKEAENAQRLVEQLRTKGYSPRLETLTLSGSGKWHRVLIGSFPTREEALNFAAEFNRKERMEGLVIRESP